VRLKLPDDGLERNNVAVAPCEAGLGLRTHSAGRLRLNLGGAHTSRQCVRLESSLTDAFSVQRRLCGVAAL
jgi:hypothetical protein